MHGGVAREIFVERLIGKRGGGARRGHGHAEDRIGAELSLSGRAVEVAHFLVEHLLRGGVRANQRRTNHLVNVVNGLEDPFAQVARLIAVAQFKRFVLACGGAGRHRGAAAMAGSDGDVGLDRGIAAGVENLAAFHSDDAGRHGEFSGTRKGLFGTGTYSGSSSIDSSRTTTTTPPGETK